MPWNKENILFKTIICCLCSQSRSVECEPHADIAYIQPLEEMFGRGVSMTDFYGFLSQGLLENVRNAVREDETCKEVVAERNWEF